MSFLVQKNKPYFSESTVEVLNMREQQQPSGAPMDDMDLRQVKKLQDGYDKIKREIHKVFVGQDEVLEELLVALLCRGHVLLEGVPGLGKTFLIQSLSKVLNLKFRRIQFTPDLMPTDITGTEIIEEDPETGRRRFRYIEGPVFANIVLADEINRTPPKTQAALLEAMQEHSVTYAGQSYKLQQPFFVLATQNPIEQEGTYPLPEAQLDRFMFKINILYPSRDEEEEIVAQTTVDHDSGLEQVLSDEDIIELQSIVRKVPVAPHIVRFAVGLVRSTRPNEEEAPSFVKELISWGAGPRAAQYLILGGKAMALLNERFNVAREDIVRIAPAVLRHRIVPSFAAEADNISVDTIIARLLASMKDMARA